MTASVQSSPTWTCQLQPHSTWSTSEIHVADNYLMALKEIKDLTCGNGLVWTEELNASRTSSGCVVNTFPIPGCDIHEDVFTFWAALSKIWINCLSKRGTCTEIGNECECRTKRHPSRGELDVSGWQANPVMQSWLMKNWKISVVKFMIS